MEAWSAVGGGELSLPGEYCKGFPEKGAFELKHESVAVSLAGWHVWSRGQLVHRLVVSVLCLRRQLRKRQVDKQSHKKKDNGEIVKTLRNVWRGGRARWLTPVILALGRPGRVGHEVERSRPSWSPW